MPVPRRYDRRPPERDQTRINDRIRVPEVRLVGADGKQIGVVKTSEALSYAQERDLDLVEVAPEARPPVCRVLDYSKFKYEQALKQKAARKHQQQITIREIKFRPKIAQNDYDTKKGHVERFLRGKDKVKITIMFRGREVTHPERGVALLDKLAGELSDLAVVEQSPLQDGRNMTMMLAPSKSVLALDDHEPDEHDDGVPRGKKPHKHDQHAEAAPEATAPDGAEVAEDDFDDETEIAPITEIEPITAIEPAPAAPVAAPAVPESVDVEETPSGRPARKLKSAPKGGTAAKRAAALRAVADDAATADADADVRTNTAATLSSAPVEAAGSPQPTPGTVTAETAPAEPAPTGEETPAPRRKPAAKPSATKPASPKPRAPKSAAAGTVNGSPEPGPGQRPAASPAKAKASSAAKAD